MKKATRERKAIFIKTSFNHANPSRLVSLSSDSTGEVESHQDYCERDHKERIKESA